MKYIIVTVLFFVITALVFNGYLTQLKMERNKNNVLKFYDLMFNQNKPDEAVKLYVGDVYIQHNPLVKDGKQGFIDYFEKMQKAFPGKHVVFKKVFSEKNYVIFHCLQQWPGDKDYASIDIFRLNEQGKIVEHWDVLQVIPNDSENKNTMF